MKSNSYNKTAVLTLLAAALVVASWPVAGRSQSSSRRDRERYRQDRSAGADSTRSRLESSRRPDSAKVEAARPGTTPAGAAASKDGQAGRITKSAEPTPAPRPVERRSSPRTNRGEQWAKYSIILDRNMFSRQRVKPLPPGAVLEEPLKVMPNPESYFLLKGVAQENKQFIAFVEDKRTGSVLRLREGDTVARGMVKSLNLDGLQYQFQDKAISVGMGSDLEGGSGALTAGDLANFSPTAAPAGSSAPPADEAEILKRLMEQRQQQLGR